MSKKTQQIAVPLISVVLGILLGAIIMWIFGYDAIWLVELASSTLVCLGKLWQDGLLPVGLLYHFQIYRVHLCSS